MYIISQNDLKHIFLADQITKICVIFISVAVIKCDAWLCLHWELEYLIKQFLSVKIWY